MATLPTYKKVAYWKGYQRFFPPELRLHSGNLPEESYWPWRGLSVHLDRYVSKDARLKLIIVHGGAGYSRMFSACSLAAKQSGAEVLAPDLPGCGLTQAPRGYSYEDWVDCLVDLIALEQTRDERPVVLFGASLGGMVAYAAASKARRVAGIVATSLLDPRNPEVRSAVTRTPWLAPVTRPVLRAFGPVMGRVQVPIKWVAKLGEMSRNPKLNELVAEDPQGGDRRVPLRFLESYLHYQPPVEPETFDVCPLVLVHPAKDRWTPPELSKSFFDRLRVPKQWVLLQKAGHFPVEEPGFSQLRMALSGFLSERAKTLQFGE
jgi:alpha-beta hydrolase superfamily lysophospholipase